MNRFFFILILFSGFHVFAQTETQIEISPKSSKLDTNYIEDLSHHFNLYMYGKTKYKNFGIKNNETNQRLNFSPNDRFNIGIGFNYKWMGLGLAFNLPFINNDDDKYGKTKRFDAQMNIFAHRYLLDFYFNFYKGYYISNPEVLNPEFDKSGSYPTIPSMKTNDFGISYYYILNHKKFSYRASFIQNEKQKKMAGSIIFGFITHISNTSADSTFIPTKFLKDIEDFENYRLNNFSAFDIGPMMGYAYNFVIAKRFLITLSTVPGLVLQSISASGKHQGETYNTGGTKIGLVINNRFAISYNGEKYFWGFNYNDFHSLHNYDKITTNSNVGNFRLFWGRRFGQAKKK